jgi:hypothetical protein
MNNEVVIIHVLYLTQSETFKIVPKQQKLYSHVYPAEHKTKENITKIDISGLLDFYSE